ncbi:helix-turn-helix domain-containing protein [Deefgea tanakiae]|uniref:Helix-turn-helix domain-containing protein n=1 Tax=Deefgea tanakiae TaxID=2865840 RepID=A0ABX8Z7T3_9NEIS|nr:helix-turn-helix domain-containing protein [Deefgea tanakiae]QZA78652.1 helix-turn-helix domain-containing protein [Deefgea tanakiae]
MPLPATPLMYRINAAVTTLGLSRATIYRLVKQGELELVKLSTNASAIPADSLHAYLARCQPAKREG